MTPRVSSPVLYRVGTSFLFAVILASVACSKETTQPDLVLEKRGANLVDQDLLPAGDVSNPGAFGGCGTSGSLWASLDGYDDSDCIYRARYGLPPTMSEATVALASPVETPDPSQVANVVVRWKVSGNYSTSWPQPTYLQYCLLQNGVQKACSYATVSSSYTTSSFGVSGSQLGNFVGLSIRFVLELKPASDLDQIYAYISQARVEVR